MARPERYRQKSRRKLFWLIATSCFAASLPILFPPPAAFAADVVTDGDMELVGIANWPHTDVAGSNTSAKATDQSASGQSLKGTSQTGNQVTREWLNTQSVGLIDAASTVTLSLWYGRQHFVDTRGGAGVTFYVDVRPASGSWTNIWTSGVLGASASFNSATVNNLDVSAFFSTTESYEIRLRVNGGTGKNNAAYFAVWWDDVVLDVVSAAATTTVGDGTEAANVNRCPGDGAAELDAFTLNTDAGTDTVTAVEVTLAAGTVAGLALVEITDDGGGTVYGSVSNPVFDTLAISLGTNIGVTTTATQAKVRITPKGHAAMPAPPGSTYTVTGTVTAITCTNTKAYNDASSAAVTIDNQSPGDATWGTVTAGDGQVDLAWTNPGDGDFSEVVILRAPAAISDAPAEGATYAAGNPIGSSTVVYVGGGTNTTDATVTNGTDYWYKIFAQDGCGNYAAGVETGPHTPAGPANNAVTTGAPSAVVNGCNQITVSAPFTDDDNGSSTTTVRRGTTPGGPFPSTICNGLSGASPRICVDNTVLESSTYFYEITFSDADGVNGSNPQEIGPYSTPAAGDDATTIGANTAVGTSCRQITVTSTFSGDANGNGSVQVEYLDGGWLVACATVQGASPRQCLIPGLSPGTSYDVRVTFTDPDGVTGTNPETIAPMPATPACGGSDVPPTVMFLAPAEGATIGGTERIKLQIYDDGVLSSVRWDWNGLGFPPANTAAVNANYTCGTGCSVWEFALDISGEPNQGHYIAIQAIDDDGYQAVVTQPVQVFNVGGDPGGDGTLLRRTRGSQLCIDCHNMPTHSSQMTDAGYGNWAIECFTCHTPHRTTNIFLINETIETPNSGTATNVFFRNLTGMADFSYASSTSPGTALCEVCHTRTNYYNNSGAGGGHFTDPCTDCHEHDGGFAGGGGCLVCHGTTVQGGHRAVEADFSKQSHHVGNGGATMGGTLTDFDCVVCHGEGTVSDGEVTTVAALHGYDGGTATIDLRDADNLGNTFPYDIDAVAASAGAAANWNSSDAVWLAENRDNLDPFCLTCHDSDGAAASYTLGDTGATASNPFTDADITNEYDQLSRGGVVDIASMVVSSGSDLDQVGEARGPDGIPDPPQGIYSRHAIRGQSVSVYTTQQIPAGYWNQSQFAWNDTSVMGCADCHTTDGANATDGNAHGSGSEYLLKDAGGTAAEGALGSSNYICYRCHAVGTYDVGTGHTPNTGDYQDYVTQTGTNRVPVGGTGGSIYGNACTNCHGGYGFGTIHGTSQVIGVGQNGGNGTREAYRFMNGGSMRFYDPNGWTTGSYTCYTLTTGGADSWGGCTKHGGGKGGSRLFTRPLSY